MSEIKKQKKKESFAPIGKVSNRWGWGFVSISVIMISVLVFIPMIQSFLLSLQSGQGNQLTFAGLSNYKRMLTDTTFRKALVNTFLYLLVQVPVMIIIDLFISDMRIYLCRSEVCVSENRLQYTNVNAVLIHKRRRGMTEFMC